MERVTVDCSICGSTDDQSFREVDGYRVARCNVCGFLFINPRPTPEGLAELYRNRATNKFFSEGYEPPELEAPVLTKVLDTIQRYVRSGAMLEIGCGRGDLLALAGICGFRPTGVDFFDGKPPATPGVTFFDGPLAAAKFPDASFDVVVIRNVLEHLFDPRKEVADAFRLLKPGGYFYAKVPNAMAGEGPFYRRFVAPRYPFAPPYHLSHFSPASMKRLLTNAGFKFVRWSVEQPTIVRSGKNNFVRQSAYRVFTALDTLTSGRFPQMTIACIVKKT